MGCKTALPFFLTFTPSVNTFSPFLSPKSLRLMQISYTREERVLGYINKNLDVLRTSFKKGKINRLCACIPIKKVKTLLS